MAVFGLLTVSATPVLSRWTDLGTVLATSLAITCCCVMSFYYNDLYDFRSVRSLDQFVPRLLKSLLLAFVFLTIFYAIVQPKNVTGEQFLLSLFLIATVILCLRAVSYGVISRRLFSEPVLILGTGPLAQTIADELTAAPHLRCVVAGLVEVGDGRASDPGGSSATRYPVYGPMQDWQRTLAEVQPKRIVVALTERRGRLPIRELLHSSVSGTIVEDGVEVFERLTGKLAIDSIVPSEVLYSKKYRKSRLLAWSARAFSFVVALGALLFLAPVFLLVAVAIKLDSGGPVLFVQPRLGLSNRPFRLLKFRTMHPGNKRTEWAQDNEDQITRAGAWLRKYRIDELPQFFNVLRGDMNLVGPRPHPVTNHRLFAENISYYFLRSLVRPGITGWAQVRYGYANNLEEEREKVRYDLYYIKHLSLWLDIRILVDTVKIVLFGRRTSSGSHA